MKIALAQLDPIIGDIDANRDAVLKAMRLAREGGADVLLCPELAICGYPPRDLLLRAGFVEACEEAVGQIAAQSEECCIIVGAPRRMEHGGLANSAFVCHEGKIQAVADKQLLPGYDVFDEDRYFRPGQRACECRLDGRHIGVLLCEDAWQANDTVCDDRYALNPVADLAAAGVELLFVPSASPFVVGKHARHAAELTRLASRHEMSVVVVNQRGGNDDLVFNGESFAVDAGGRVIHARGEFVGAAGSIDLVEMDGGQPSAVVELDDVEARYRALVEGVAGYARKTGHSELVIGLRGGPDPARPAGPAAAAGGGAHVTGVLMPSRWSSAGSVDDARDLAQRLGLGDVVELPIHQLHAGVLETLAASDAMATGLTDQNIQARLRGLLLMAMANERGALVLATGNKSELAMGYATLYGDMNGALAVLGDVYKTQVQDMAKWVNLHPDAAGFDRPPMPEASITKPPSAELAPDQLDEDSLPPYVVLDDVLRRLIDQDGSVAEILRDTDHDPDVVDRVARSLDRAQFKRDQAPVILKTSPRAFGRGRPWPIVSRDGSRVEQPAHERSTDRSV
ncbi:MAG: NAD+ synthase [Phycisphaerales bacterium]|nr:NAD+ synthase [Phycisphaerales bacterium]